MSSRILCDMVHIKYPVFQGGMAWISDSSLAAGVSNAGAWNNYRECSFFLGEKRNTQNKKSLHITLLASI